MHLFNHVPDGIKLHSGEISIWKVDCDALTDDDLDGIAEMLRVILLPYGAVYGIPRGGTRLAERMERFVDPDRARRLLIVDDVYTTGTSMDKAAADYRPVMDETIGAVIFARGPVPDWITPLWTHYEALRSSR